MKKRNNIFLVGPMGSGKTSVGIQLAQLSHLIFYDSDSEIEKRTGVSISWIFEIEKESGFRLREQNIIAELTQLDGIVLSTGGGAVISEVNRQHLMDRGIVVYLRVSLEKQLARVMRRKGVRPLVDEQNPEEKLIKLNQQRELLYEKSADLIYNTDNLTPFQLARKILADIALLSEQ